MIDRNLKKTLLMIYHFLSDVSIRSFLTEFNFRMDINIIVDLITTNKDIKLVTNNYKELKLIGYNFTQ